MPYAAIRDAVAAAVDGLPFERVDVNYDRGLDEGLTPYLVVQPLREFRERRDLDGQYLSTYVFALQVYVRLDAGMGRVEPDWEASLAAIKAGIAADRTLNGTALDCDVTGWEDNLLPVEIGSAIYRRWTVTVQAQVMEE